MTGQRKVIHADEQLYTGSIYLRYHVKMYVETLLSIQSQPTPLGWQTQYNAILDSHLIHARILINFLNTSSSRKTDVCAIDYFYVEQSQFDLVIDEFLKNQVEKIGGNLVHITTKPMPYLKSEQPWPVDEIKRKLVPLLKTFFYVVPENKMVDGLKDECLNYLSMLSTNKISVSPHAST